MSTTEAGYRWAGPTAARLLVGAQLRRLREAANLTCEEVARAIHGSGSKVSRLETGRTGFKPADLAVLLSLYGVSEDESATLLALARQANMPGWWHYFGDAVPGWFAPYLGLEGAASVIRTHEIQFVPGLLQTRDYARAVIAQGYDDPSADQVERRVAMRMRRQDLLRRENPPRLWAVIDEAALRRPIGGRAVMREQLRHLIWLSRLPHVSVQILPFSAGLVAAAGAMTMLRFPEGELPDVVYLEQFAGARYLDKQGETEAYVHVLNQLGTAARPPTATPSLVSRMLAQL
jgi:transcriptional regulator with XRE-family HTH domain